MSDEARDLDMRYADPVMRITLGTALALGAYNVATGTNDATGFVAYGLVFLLALGATVQGLLRGVEAAVATGLAGEGDPLTTSEGSQQADGTAAE